MALSACSARRAEQDMARLAFHFGRVVLAALFILAGVSKLLNYEATRAMMDGVGLSPSNILLPATIALELVGGLLVAAGMRFAVPAAIVLALFTLATNWYFHPFWLMEGAVQRTELSLFFKNVAVFGGLLAVAGVIAERRKGFA
jgi:putative oxidoreductase